MKTLFACMTVVLVAGCVHFKRVPESHALSTGQKLTLSHTQLCVGDGAPLEVEFEPVTPLTWFLVDQTGATLQTGEVRERVDVSVTALAVGKYRVVVPVSGQNLEGGFEVHHCALY